MGGHNQWWKHRLYLVRELPGTSLATYSKPTVFMKSRLSMIVQQFEALGFLSIGV